MHIKLTESKLDQRLLMQRHNNIAALGRWNGPSFNYCFSNNTSYDIGTRLIPRFMVLSFLLQQILRSNSSNHKTTYI